MLKYELFTIKYLLMTPVSYRIGIMHLYEVKENILIMIQKSQQKKEDRKQKRKKKERKRRKKKERKEKQGAVVTKVSSK